MVMHALDNGAAAARQVATIPILALLHLNAAGTCLSCVICAPLYGCAIQPPSMCGITGIFDTRSARAIDRAVLQRMNDSQLHRGPDEGSLHLEPGVGLGHRRLSIIDIATGQQPLFNEDGSVVIVYNGEIYNYQSLIPELQALGHVFHSRSDTEVIVHAWESWGTDCVQRFRGMFAFALWDRNQQTLFMARDRLGVKPLHYTVLDNGQLLFG